MGSSAEIVAALIDRLCHSLRLSGNLEGRCPPPTRRLLTAEMMVLSSAFPFPSVKFINTALHRKTAQPNVRRSQQSADVFPAVAIRSKQHPSPLLVEGSQVIPFNTFNGNYDHNVSIMCG